MKKYLITLSIFSLAISARSQIQIDNTRWNAHTDIPLSMEIQLAFKKDSFLIQSQNGKQLGELMTYSLRGDSLYLRKISGQTPCDNGTEGWYRIQPLQNSE